MASMVEQLEEQPPAKKPRIDNPEEQKEIANESNLAKSTEMMEHKVSETSTITTMDLPPSSRVPLPLELNCEVFKCLKLPIQRKFIWGLGRDIYGMFGQKLLKKTKRVRNPHENRWNNTNTRATVAPNGLDVSGTNTNGFPKVFTVQAFIISGPQCRIDDFPGTILYYYEVKGPLLMSCVGLSHAMADDNSWIGEYSNSYAVSPLFFNHRDDCRLAEERYRFELPKGAIRPERKQFGNVFGCGLVLDPEDKLAIFFTLNGKLRGRKIPINPTVDHLFPALKLMCSVYEANFGDDPAKPFEYDIKNCPGLELACI